MSKIVWAGIIKGEVKNPTGAIPQNARRLKEPDSLNGTMIAAIPFMIPSVILCIASLIIKIRINKELFNFSAYLLIGCLVGCAIGFLLMIAHEYLHAVVYPREATVKIGISPKSIAAAILVSYPISRNRFIFMSLLPIVLGIIPLCVFWIIPITSQFLNGLLWGTAIMGLISVYPDLFNIYNVLKQVPPNANVQFSETHTFWF